MTESKLIKTLTDYGNLSVKGAKKYWCGEQVGSGCFRDVYELKHDPRYVVKLIYKNDVFDNIKEWLIWNEVKDCDAIAQWFADCIVITASGTVLVQRRAEPGKRKDFPKRIPDFFTDLKVQNFGFIDERFVCVDYGSFLFSRLIDIKKGQIVRTRYAKWWTLTEKNHKALTKKLNQLP